MSNKGDYAGTDWQPG